MSLASDLLTQYVSLIEQYELKVEPLVDRWISMQVQMKKLDSSCTRECYIPHESSIDKSKLCFVVQNPDRDYFNGPTYLWIPTDYFEDQAPYEQELEDYLKNIEATKKSARKVSAQKRVDTLKSELSMALVKLAAEQNDS